MRFAAGLAAFLLWIEMPAAAFAEALPATLRSAGVTEAQWTQAQGVIRVQATTLSLREDAVQTLAVEIFEGQPNLSFESYLGLIREGASRLPALLAAARTLDPTNDPTLADLQRRALAAAEAGRLSETLVLQDQYRALRRQSIERALEQPYLEIAAVDAAAGDTALTLGRYIDAAERYADAAETAPASAVEMRWRYRLQQAGALAERGVAFAEPSSLREAIRLYEDVVLPLAPRRSRPADWAQTQNSLGIALTNQSASGVAGAIERAIAALEAALTVNTQAANASAWAVLQMDLGNALLLQAQRGDSVALLDRVFAAYDSASTVITREVDPVRWASLEANFGAALVLVEQRSGRLGVINNAISAYEASLTVRTREADPVGWARSQAGLGDALRAAGDEQRAATAYEAALTVMTRQANPAQWARLQMNLGDLLIGMRRFWDPRERAAPPAEALDRAFAAYNAALTVVTREADRASWARVQASLGFANYLQARLDVPGALERAAAAYDASLTVRTREADLAGWGLSMYGLARVYDAMGRTEDARTAIQGALDAFEQTDQRLEAQGALMFRRRLQQH